MARGSAGALGGADPRKSYLVAPFDVLSPDPQLAWLREGAVSMLSLDLAQWRDLKVIDYERGLDLQRDLKLDGRRIGREDAIRMARRAGVGSVVTGRVTGTPDSTLVLATVYDVESGSKVDSAQRSAPRGADPRALFDALARDLLDLVGAPAGTQALAQSVTSSVEAYRDYLEASRALNAWQLPRADSLFGAAISADSTFALAYYKRALTYGWWKAGDTTQLAMIRQATRNAGRLPARERGLLDAYAAFATAMYGGTDVPDSVRNARFTDAERMYAAALTRDSADAEAWYGLADAYYHHQTGNWGDSTTRDHWTRALAGFNRTLALDSSFHLAYSHKVNIYQQAAAPNSPLVLDGEVLRSLNDAATRQTFQGARLTAAKRRAQELGVREARAWAAADPVPPAFFAVAQAYLPAHWDSAAAALDDAVRRLGPGEAGMLPFAYAFVAARTDPVRARDALHAALQTDSASLARAGGSDRFQFIVASMQVAAMTGALRDLDVAARLAAAAQPSIPGTRVPTSMIVQWWAAGLKLAAGAPSASVRPMVDGGLGGRDAMPGRLGESARRQSMLVPYVALLVTREPKYRAMLTKWAGGDAGTWPEADALAALGVGDSARARAATSRFPSPDSMRAATSGMNAARWVARAEVLAALGDAPRALAMYEVLDPRRFGDVSVFDPALVLWARSYLARGRLYEQLGQRPQAAAAYDRFVTLWKDADPSLQPQVREARAGLARVRDQGAGQAVR
jgi:tetratricopeptide (TPR) repeat protein/TolB-like protein